MDDGIGCPLVRHLVVNEVFCLLANFKGSLNTQRQRWSEADLISPWPRCDRFVM